MNATGSISFDLRPPEGKRLAKKWSMFVMLGEPGYPRRHVEALAAGAIGTAKSSALVAWLVMRALSYPGIRLAMARDTYENLKRSTLQTLFERANGTIAEDSSSYNEDHHIAFFNKRENKIIFKNGSTIWLFGLSDQRAIDRLVGTEWGGIGVDQLERVPQKVYESLITRLRQKVYHVETGEVVFPMIKSTANLDFGRSSWVFRRFFDGSTPFGVGEIAEDVREKRVITRIGDQTYEAWRAYFAFRFGENESINPYYTTALASAGDGISHFIADDWDPSLDEVFGTEWKSEYAYQNSAPMDAEGKHIIVGLDFGVDSPTVAIVGVYDPDSEIVYIDGEYHAANMDAKLYAADVGVLLNEYMRRGARSLHVYADPSMWNRTGVSSQTAADVFALKLRSMVPSGAFMTFQQAYTKGTFTLRDPATVAPIKEAMRSGRIRVNRLRAPITLETIQTITWGQVRRDVHPVTDFFDAFRYLIGNVPSNAFLKSDDEDDDAPRKRRKIMWRYS